jgi:hypothetical protein
VIPWPKKRTVTVTKKTRDSFYADARESTVRVTRSGNIRFHIIIITCILEYRASLLPIRWSMGLIHHLFKSISPERILGHSIFSQGNRNKHAAIGDVNETTLVVPQVMLRTVTP